jgi:hypothetical protein
MTERKLGQYLDELGIICDLGDQDVVLDAMVIMRLQSLEDGETRFGLAYSKHTDFIVRGGLLKRANDLDELETVMAIDDDDEDGVL